MLKNSLVMKRLTSRLVYLRKQSTGLASGPPFFKPDISSDAESHEEQDVAKHFVVRPATAELWPIL